MTSLFSCLRHARQASAALLIVSLIAVQFPAIAIAQDLPVEASPTVEEPAIEEPEEKTDEIVEQEPETPEEPEVPAETEETTKSQEDIERLSVTPEGFTDDTTPPLDSDVGPSVQGLFRAFVTTVLPPSASSTKSITVQKAFADGTEGNCEDFSFTIEESNSTHVTTQPFDGDCEVLVPITENGSYVVFETEASAEGYEVTYSDNVNANNKPGCHLEVSNGNPERTCTITNERAVEEAPSCLLVSDTEDTVVAEGAVTAVTPHAAWTDELDADGASWIWTEPDATGIATFTRTVFLDAEPSTATLTIAADNGYTALVNGAPVACDGSGTGNFGSADSCAIDLDAGENTLTFTVTNLGGPHAPPSNPAGLYYRISVEGASCTDAPPPPPPTCEAGVNLVENGSFEEPTVGTAQNWTVIESGASPLAWLAEWIAGPASFGGFDRPEAAQVELQRTGVVAGWTASDGDQWAELDSDWFGPSHGLSGEPAALDLYQKIETIPGETYVVAFDYAPRPGTAGGQNAIDAYHDGTTALVLGPVAGAAGPVNWTPASYQFVATDTMTRVGFRDAGGPSDSLGALLDNVHVSCDPEPEEPEEPEQCVVVSDVTTLEGGDASVLSTYLHASWTATMDALAQWIWGEDHALTDAAADEETQTFTKTFWLESAAAGATLEIAADNGYGIELNGVEIGADPEEYNYTADGQDELVIDGSAFMVGENTLVITVTNHAQAGGTWESNPAGLRYKLTIDGTECGDEPKEPAQSSITIVKQSVGGTGTFDINVKDAGPVLPPDPFDWTASITTTKEGVASSSMQYAPPDTYIVEEMVPAGWELTSVSCTGEVGTTSPLTVTIEEGEEVVCTFVNTKLSEPRESEIIQPEVDEETSGTTELLAYYADENSDGNDGVQWAVRAGTCDAGMNTEFGNVDGFNTPFVWNGIDFSADIDTTTVPNGEYCFVFNPTEDAGNENQRLTRMFTINNKDDGGEPTEPDEVTITVTGDTSAGENELGWLFNRDQGTQSPFEFVLGNASIGTGALFVEPIENDINGVSDKFIAELFMLEEVADVNSITYDFKIGAPDDTVEEHFYMSVYMNFGESSPTKFYDCRYSIVPTAGSTGSYTTVTFDPTQTYPVTTRTGSEASPYPCPGSPADMDNLGTGSSTIRVIAINVGDTSVNDQGVGGYLDKVVVSLTDLITTYDFEQAPPSIITDDEDNGGGGGGGSSSFARARGEVLGATTAACSALLDTYMRIGITNDVAEVIELQGFLNEHIGAGLPLTGFFGPMTDAAVHAFQKQYWEDVLKPWFPYPDAGIADADDSTGYVYKTTQWKINDIYCPGIAPLPQLP